MKLAWKQDCTVIFCFFPHSTTLAAPCELLMKRKIRLRIDVITPNLSRQVEEKQIQMKERLDAKA